MREKLPYFFLVAFLWIVPKDSIAQSANVQDSMALVDLYDSTNGPGWINHTNWLTAAPLRTWFGVYLDSGRASRLQLYRNKLIGRIPSTIGNITNLKFLTLDQNQLSGSIPRSIGNLPKLINFSVSENLLSGDIPVFQNPKSVYVDVRSNKFTFSALQKLLSYGLLGSAYYPQADIPLHRNGNVLSVDAGGNLSDNTYTWYLGDSVITSKSRDSTFTITKEGNYYAEVANAIIPSFSLYSISIADNQDSLILVNFYNNNGGNGWNDNTNWLTTEPLSTWYRVKIRGGKVASLGVSSNNVTGTIPTDFGRLSNLQVLDLQSNNLSGNIPDSIGNLSKLLYLYLSYNQLSGSIPSSFGNLRRLNGLYLKNNNFTGKIPVSFANLNLINAIDLSYNQLTDTIPNIFTNFTSFFKELNLNNNKLSGSIPLSLTYYPIRLTSLNLSNNQLTGNVPYFSPNLAELNNVDLSYNHLSGTFPSIPQTTPIRNLLIGVNNFTFSGLENFPGAVSYLRYAPQSNITLTRHKNLLSVSAGGTLTKETFNLYRNGALTTTQNGDSVFSITNTGQYYVTITNSAAPNLTLQSDIDTIDFMLPDTTFTVTESITGSSPTEMDSLFYKLISITPGSGTNAINGNVTAMVAIDSAVSTFHNQPYVQRHYDIKPAFNAANATATVTLYFTQQDFDNFNNFVTKNNLGLPLLPTGGVDNGNVRIIQLHGTFTASPVPSNYNDTVSVLITPNVQWNAVDKWWTVTFPVEGFSGFFLSTGNFTLPLTLLEFDGHKINSVVKLQWQTAGELSVNKFTVERSADGRRFDQLGTVDATNSNNLSTYNFTDNNPMSGDNYYRLRIADIDGKVTSSKVINIKIDKNDVLLSAYPNPVKKIVTLKLSSPSATTYVMMIRNEIGKTVRSIRGRLANGISTIRVDMHPYSRGIYFITLAYGDKVTTIRISKE